MAHSCTCSLLGECMRRTRRKEQRTMHPSRLEKRVIHTDSQYASMLAAFQRCFNPGLVFRCYCWPLLHLSCFALGKHEGIFRPQPFSSVGACGFATVSGQASLVVLSLIANVVCIFLTFARIRFGFGWSLENIFLHFMCSKWQSLFACTICIAYV